MFRALLPSILGFFLFLRPPLSGAAETPGVVEIKHPEEFTQVLGVSDVHGMYEPLATLLKAAGVVSPDLHWKAGKTLLIIVGDSIDKGPDSVGVLALWIKLTEEAKKSGGRVLHLLGNHEAEFLADGKASKKARALLRELKKKGIRSKHFLSPSREYGAFLHSMPVAAKIGKWLFSHAGYFPDMTWKDFSARSTRVVSAGLYEDPLLSDPDSILEAKDWWVKKKRRKELETRLAANGFYGMVQGHQPKAFGIKNKMGSVNSNRWVKLDTGMAPEAGSHPGKLLRLSNPGDLNQEKRPHFEVISNDGKISELPEYYF